MKNNDLIITTSNFESLVASLHSNLKLGYGKCSKIEFINSFYRAVLEHGKDASYITRLASVSTFEGDNELDLMHYLANGVAPVYEPITACLVEEIKDILELADVNKQKDEEAVKVKRTRRPKKEMK